MAVALLGCHNAEEERRLAAERKAAEQAASAKREQEAAELAAKKETEDLFAKLVSQGAPLATKELLTKWLHRAEGRDCEEVLSLLSSEKDAKFQSRISDYPLVPVFIENTFFELAQNEFEKKRRETALADAKKACLKKLSAEPEGIVPKVVRFSFLLKSDQYDFANKKYRLWVADKDVKTQDYRSFVLLTKWHDQNLALDSVGGRDLDANANGLQPSIPAAPETAEALKSRVSSTNLRLELAVQKLRYEMVSFSASGFSLEHGWVVSGLAYRIVDERGDLVPWVPTFR